MEGAPDGAPFRAKAPGGMPGAWYQGGANDRDCCDPILVDAENEQDEDQEQQEYQHRTTATANTLGFNFRHENTSFGFESLGPLVQ